MAMVEGVGDEVVEFMVAVMLVAIAMLAWWSTNARPSRYRTVLVMRSRVHPVTVSIRTVSSSHMPISSEGTSSNGRVIPVQEMDSIIDADMAMLNNQRLHFYRRIDAPSASQEVAELASAEGAGAEGAEDAGGERAGAAQIHEMESIVSAMEADVTHVRANTQPLRNVSESLATVSNGEVGSDQNDASSSNPSEQNETSAEEPSGDVVGNRSKILIKLKYLNDTLKEVEGCLDELLKDFKWRHFSTELSSARLVRLVYRGRVLPDASTLRDCGLHHRAVVHCLVHNQRGAGGGAGGAGGGAVRAGEGAVLAEAAPPERAWDLENILMTIVSVVLTVIWFFRCEYSNLFTASASVALFGLTVFYSVSIFGLYLAEAIPLDVRAVHAPAPAPARPSLNTDN